MCIRDRFKGVKTRFSWLLPIVSEAYASKRIFNAIRQNERVCNMPFAVGLCTLKPILPVCLSDALLDFLGINASMDEFKGRHQQLTETSQGLARKYLSAQRRKGRNHTLRDFST
eukprot:TRINITY_DN7512_c0_g1_i4.p2 TRINITY_DN7512_c0_g1~~TRINITY_DN7512_c0_g1_i4.p2  ORF type:complete len:114 (-),score=22.55 TRINITY_DN7512_c0_g1_i4:286-627(-)